MKSSLIYYPHGLGDVIMLTPCMRELFNDGYKTTLLCHVDVVESHLLDDCPYIESIVPVANPWRCEKGFEIETQRKLNLDTYENMKHDYEFAGKCLHKDFKDGQHKIDKNAEELDINLTDRHLEVWIPEQAKEAVDLVWGDYGFLFLHNVVPDHPYHSWDGAGEWCNENLLKIGIVYDTSNFIDDEYQSPNINLTFALLEKAKHRVICSSVFVHACEALNLEIDCLYYGRPDPKVEPLNEALVKHKIIGGK